jgi:hypothetical protein
VADAEYFCCDASIFSSPMEARDAIPHRIPANRIKTAEFRISAVSNTVGQLARPSWEAVRTGNRDPPDDQPSLQGRQLNFRARGGTYPFAKKFHLPIRAG